MLNFSWFHISPPYWKFQFLFLSMILFLLVVFLDRRQPCPIKLVLLVIIGWWVGWLVRNAVFSEAARRIFLIFCMKSGEAYKGTEPDFWEKFLIWRYSRKGLQISPQSDTIFLKNSSNDFLGFWPMFNLNETYFSEKCGDIWPRNRPNICPNWRFWPFFRLCIISFPWFCT